MNMNYVLFGELREMFMNKNLISLEEQKHVPTYLRSKCDISYTKTRQL